MDRLISLVLDLIYPPRCSGCNKVMARGRVICSSCMDNLPHYNTDYCAICGKLEYICRCVETSGLDGVFAPYGYSGVMKGIILRLKLKKDYKLARELSSAMSPLILPYKKYITHIVAVPMSEKSRKEGRHNQAVLLAEYIAKDLGISLTRGWLSRSDSSKAQHGLEKNQRMDNARNSYDVIAKVPEGAVVLIVDDVFTTGATVVAISEKLKEAGCSSVFAVTVAVTNN